MLLSLEVSGLLPDNRRCFATRVVQGIVLVVVPLPAMLAVLNVLATKARGMIHAFLSRSGFTFSRTNSKTASYCAASCSVRSTPKSMIQIRAGVVLNLPRSPRSQHVRVCLPCGSGASVIRVLARQVCQIHRPLSFP